ncbi:bifunctional diaminohydroxyphosphoribosylaminopyrimidine deaminase/5-amino-6-(5-phosphoribosylamino)uracil reductase RibD [Acetobacter sp. AN02]|uniref:bifunctional diaminohydroxyphosphoribosylaminopyrimidine deaminase/5-amino-6-(5-phosphoribosylamino)uracil reductase RibD n=1 Tax=Acetobacter sp. AN02 TaxID=2894186 RepID=UPI00243463D9|nr:bifunctional diaminohydroxyphosphoribosylaminopyrimidine deaminase/5-amino-6-(5-phosphoribosylamino)uracil reductase RibD [Acetobacter sp. AN02]MDG6093680.1 bifunctional diaminohydroxyphosphoribosylaminopyrimidine deaminase/5-amino-6-(5-phosphoribosylamino)uracil reductase RibD [Acetobacter sp. AN02]
MISTCTEITGPVRAAFYAALDEARRFVGATAPNPPVGCALLDEDGVILTVAAHHRAGTMHAEARALAQAQALGMMSRVVTAVVTLEPCNHTGRTPPCSEALLASPVRTVWIGCADPDPRVAGGGAARLREAGREVCRLEHGGAPELFAACRALIAPFVWRAVHGRAWISVKQALDVSGSMIPPAGQTTFTSERALTLAHELRRATDAVVTGTGTVLADCPGLDVRRVPDHAEVRRLLVVCGDERRVPAAWRARAEARSDLCFCRDVRDLPEMIARTGRLWALVEAGPGLLTALRDAEVWDDWLTVSVRSDRVSGEDGSEVLRVRSRHDVSALSLFVSETGSVSEAGSEEAAVCFQGS